MLKEKYNLQKKKMLIKNGYVTEQQNKGQSTKTKIRNLKKG